MYVCAHSHAHSATHLVHRMLFLYNRLVRCSWRFSEIGGPKILVTVSVTDPKKKTILNRAVSRLGMHVSVVVALVLAASCLLAAADNVYTCTNVQYQYSTGTCNGDQYDLSGLYPPGG